MSDNTNQAAELARVTSSMDGNQAGALSLSFEGLGTASMEEMQKFMAAVDVLADQVFGGEVMNPGEQVSPGASNGPEQNQALSQDTMSPPDAGKGGTLGQPDVGGKQGGGMFDPNNDPFKDMQNKDPYQGMKKSADTYKQEGGKAQKAFASKNTFTALVLPPFIYTEGPVINPNLVSFVEGQYASLNSGGDYGGGSGDFSGSSGGGGGGWEDFTGGGFDGSDPVYVPPPPVQSTPSSGGRGMT